MKNLKDLGERKVIELIWKRIRKFPKIFPENVLDDVSAIEIDNDVLAVLKTDMLVESTDVPPQMSFWQIGRKAVVMNVSDMAAKGVKPIAMLVSLGLPKNLTKKEIEELIDGIEETAKEYGMYIVGGDTNEAKEIIVDCFLFGLCKKEEFVSRRGAKPGDILAVTGEFGKTAAGLKMLLEGMDAPEDISKSLLDSVLMPKAKLKEGLALAKSGVITSCIDSSDGLAWSLYELSKASNVGFILDRIPVAPEVLVFAEIHDLSAFELCFYGGEEYELVFTVKPEFWSSAVKAVESVGSHIIKIGVVIEEPKIEVLVDGKRITVEAKGWEHFKS